MVHRVSAWCEQNQLVIGQSPTAGKSNEITAIPRLLALLDVKDAVVSIDAMGCQKEIAQQIRAQGGDYLRAVKGNQKTPHKKVRALLKDVVLDQTKGLNGEQYDYSETTGQGHGRLETRRVWVSTDVQSLGQTVLDEWPTIKSLILGRKSAAGSGRSNWPGQH